MFGYFVGGTLDGQVLELPEGLEFYMSEGDEMYEREEQRIEGDDEAYYFRIS